MTIEDLLEQQILREIFVNESFFEKAYPILKPKHFTRVEQQELFKAVQQFVKKYDKHPAPQDFILFLKNYNIRNDVFDKVKMELSTILTQIQSPHEKVLEKETEEYVQKVELRDAILESVDILQSNDSNFQEIMGKVQEALSIKIDSDLGLSIKTDIESRFEYYSQVYQGYSTGIVPIDRTLGGGFREKTLSVVLAPSHGGKCHEKQTKLKTKVHKKDLDKIDEYKKFKEFSKRFNIPLKEFYEMKENQIKGNYNSEADYIVFKVLLKNKLIQDKNISLEDNIFITKVKNDEKILLKPEDIKSYKAFKEHNLKIEFKDFKKKVKKFGLKKAILMVKHNLYKTKRDVYLWLSNKEKYNLESKYKRHLNDSERTSFVNFLDGRTPTKDLFDGFKKYKEDRNKNETKY